MKALLPLFLSVFLFNFGWSQSLSEIRSEFHAAVKTPDTSKDFHKFISEIENPNSTAKAYQAVSEALLAQVLWNPFSKLSQVMKYDKIMKEVVESDPTNVEVRFLRLAIEFNLPSFLGMSTHLEEDLNKIVNNLSNISDIQVDPMFGKYIFYFLEDTKLCSEQQLLQMKQSFNKVALATEAD
ncbi:hypothetical protein [Ekhidna sp.]